MWARRYFFSSLKMSKKVNNCKKHIKKLSKPVQNRYFGIQNHEFWLRNPGSNGDPWGISVGFCGKRSARDSERVVSSIYIYYFFFFYFGCLFIDKTVRSSPWCDGSQQAGSNTAVESFWRWKFVEIWPFLWSRCVPGGFREVPEGSPGVPGGSLGSLRGPGKICSVTGVCFVGPSLFFFQPQNVQKRQKS